MTRDAPGIFSKIAGVMSANNVSILHAELNTSKRGIVLDRISVVSEVGRPVTEQMALKIELALKDALAGRKEPAEMLKKRSALFRQRGVGVETKVEVDNDVSVYYTVVDIYANDRVGLLYDLGRAFYEHGTTIELAKIMTKADAAVDAFYIKNFDGTKISDPAKLAALKEGLVKACGQ
jgi:[protein-PII] uridylyltransferase